MDEAKGDARDPEGELWTQMNQAWASGYAYAS
jgi:hypothetical protein